MPDIGWMELLVIGVVALIVVGPKDLPMMFRRLGQFTGRIRAMARDFQRAMDDAADETGMTELNRDLRKAAKYTRNPAKAGTDALKDAFGDIDLDKYPEGSHTRAAAEKRNAAAKDARQGGRDEGQARGGRRPGRSPPMSCRPPNLRPSRKRPLTPPGPVERTGTAGS
jgi:sec-independent protein translocase protein TatB